MNCKHLLVFLLIVPVLLQARDARWNTTSGVWDNPANWWEGYIPNENDRVFISGGDHVITVNHPLKLAYLHMSGFTLKGIGTLQITGDMQYGGLDQVNLQFDSVLIYGKLRSNYADGTVLKTVGADVILYDGAELIDGGLRVDGGSLYIPKNTVLDFNYYEQVYGVLHGFGSTIINDGTIRFHNEKPLWMFDYEPVLFYFNIYADTLRNNGVIDAVNADLELHANGIHKKSILRAGPNSQLFMYGAAPIHTLDSAELSAGRIWFEGNNMEVRNQSSVTALAGGLTNLAPYFSVDSSSTLNISDLYLYDSCRLFQISHDLLLNNFVHHAGTIAGPGNLKVTGKSNWGAGQVGSRFKYELTGTLTYSGSVTPYIINRRKVVLGNESTWNSPFIKLANGAYIDIPYNKTLIVTPKPGINANSISNADSTGSLLANYGTFILRNPIQDPGTLTINSTFKNARVLTIENGTLKMNGIFNNLGNVRGGGVLDIRGAKFINNGTFTPHVSKPAVLTILGSYRNNVFLADVKTNKGLTGVPGNDPNPGHDQLVVSDSIQLAGSTLRVRETGTVNPGRFVIMRCQGGPGCREGVFATTELPALYSIEYTDTTVALIKSSSLANNQMLSVGTENISFFKVLSLPGNMLQIETSGHHDIIHVVDLQGRIIKKVTVSGTTRLALAGTAAGVYVVQNITQRTSHKIRVR